jgi:hypothetical protein
MPSHSGKKNGWGIIYFLSDKQHLRNIIAHLHPSMLIKFNFLFVNTTGDGGCIPFHLLAALTPDIPVSPDFE